MEYDASTNNRVYNCQQVFSYYCMVARQNSVDSVCSRFSEYYQLRTRLSSEELNMYDWEEIVRYIKVYKKRNEFYFVESDKLTELRTFLFTFILYNIQDEVLTLSNHSFILGNQLI